MGIIGPGNTIRHLTEQLESTRKKSRNRRRAIKDLLRMNEVYVTQLRLAWTENKSLIEERSRLSGELRDLKIANKGE